MYMKILAASHERLLLSRACSYPWGRGGSVYPHNDPHYPSNEGKLKPTCVQQNN